MENAPEIAPLEKEECTPSKKKNMVRGYPNDLLLQELADGAATTINPKTGKPFRRGGLLIHIKKEHGFAWERQANTDGIWKYLIFCHQDRGAVIKIKESLKILQGGK
jgi:hypothetical protein